MMATEQEQILATPTQLKKYLETLFTDNLELRFPSTTSLKGTFAPISKIYNPLTKCVLLGAYYKKLSGLPKDEVEIENDGSETDAAETSFTVAQFGILKETGLVPLSINKIGSKLVSNTNPNIDIEFHERFYMFVDKFKGSVKMPDPILNPKIKEFVWVKDYLLNMVFDQPQQIAGIALKPHSQKDAYEAFRKDKKKVKSKGSITLKEMVARKIFKGKFR